MLRPPVPVIDGWACKCAQWQPKRGRTGRGHCGVPGALPSACAAPGNRSDIKPGETIFVVARKDEAGKLVAVRVQVSKDGIRPTQ